MPSPSPSHKSSCECCPYGYHIDLDFVRYCEAFNKASHASPASKLRERRRQRQSMEVLLGLTSPSVWQIEQQLPQVSKRNFRHLFLYAVMLYSVIFHCTQQTAYQAFRHCTYNNVTWFIFNIIKTIKSFLYLFHTLIHRQLQVCLH
jgi:hypothetical protein